MIVRSLLVAGLFASVGAGILLRPTAKSYKVDEGWLERQYPTTLGKYAMQPGSDGSMGHSYRMDPETYKTLKPYGIVGRTLSDGTSTYDVVTVAGDSEESFHNPLLCFQAQDWTVNWSKEITIQTKSRGPVRATLAQATKAGGTPQYALYTYEGPRGTISDPFQLKGDMFKSEIRSGKIQFATFFRFISLSPDISETQITQFAHDYLEASPVRPIEKLES